MLLRSGDGALGQVKVTVVVEILGWRHTRLVALGLQDPVHPLYEVGRLRDRLPLGIRLNCFVFAPLAATLLYWRIQRNVLAGLGRVVLLLK